ncbi:unnamed protein product (macronuclear) [Paramecium tetraurelia]|uniref:Chromosome undetermined scaffold_1, whole genome shotgun sequence n=1 Tax=Paramecium tetraurelia TaxID=5888 RepID=Q6BGG8_PARTE|nr:hypothetical protein [Paramecium tetraurelia strain d4-2]XP_001423458.1 uncharacterized protein GSPATT00000496001 [Paramecium tetraurelia]CAH03252.1 hypothetical protein PTMB.55c [Paramecium tetraurelia]CAK56060.1 unnamed protein product [Paramecium tetraurelia]|eukprot:XP_001423458.1 hypothetical protein (macronuclear) [Paramecium tetraurelia strain d4-2]
MQYEQKPLNVKLAQQIDLLSTDLDHILSLTKIRGKDIPYSRICQYCKFNHDYDTHHNLVMKQYSEAQFISDLIAEHDTLFQICNWAHQSLNNQNLKEQDLAWFHILQNQFHLVQNFLKDEEKCILNSLKPYGVGQYLFDFMQLSTYQNENWVLALETLHQATTSRVSNTNNKLYKWATCQSIPWCTDISKFDENLWLNIRAELFCKVMTRHSEIYPKMMKCINFGINKPYLWTPKYYELNYEDMGLGIETIGKRFIIEIIKYLTQKSNAFQLVELIEDAITALSNISQNQQFVNLRANCFYKIAIMISDLLDIDEQDECQFSQLIKRIIEFIEAENLDFVVKQKILIHLLSFLTRLSMYNQFICQMCQNIINYLGDSLGSILQLFIDYKFDKALITKIVFNQFTKLSPIQQNEIISSSFSKYFDYDQKKSYILELVPYIIKNIELFKNTSVELFQEYPEIGDFHDLYLHVYITQDYGRMKTMIQEQQIPFQWFSKYITFILENPHLEQKEICEVMNAIDINSVLFDSLENKVYLLALIAKKLTLFKTFINYLLK